MARGHNKPGVKSHRRGRRRKERAKLPVAPWIVVSTVVTLVLSSLTFGYLWLLTSGCSGDTAEAVVMVPQRLEEPLNEIAQNWSDTEPQVDGRCVGVSIKANSSAEIMAKLSRTWDTRSDGEQPHVWIAESQVWLRMAASSERGSRVIPEYTPLMASTPTVIAMPEPMADALGWKQGQEPVDLEPSWQNLITIASEKTWADYDHPEWGDIKLGLSNPRESTADLHALIGLLDGDSDGQISSDELKDTAKLKESISVDAANTTKLLGDLLGADTEDKALSYVSAFPALERDVFGYNNNQQRPNVPLEAVYPADGTTDADYPIAVLENVEWTDALHQEIGHLFAEYLREEPSQAVLAERAYRDSRQRVGTDVINDAVGLTPQIEAPPRAPADPVSVTNTLGTWQALNRKTNVLVVVDNSEGMGVAEPDGSTRLDIVRNALGNALGMFGGQSTVGVWKFSASWDGGPDYTELASLAEFDDSHKGNVDNALANMYPEGGRGLYDTAVSAYQHMQDNYQEDAKNLILLIAGGGNDDPNGLSLEQATAELRELAGTDRAVNPPTIVAIGYGDDVDDEALGEITRATQGQYFPAKWSDEIDMQLLNALFIAS
ncbi:substrate-binding domain-containing protein [Stackebrandtia soli]|uniref:substrate-binding domain-containing protein n=1 Tax=Stackebrandtia soli TaxID=1892856 RepID=UPI0039ED40D4